MHISGITKRMLAIFPEMELSEDNSGQLIVSTGAYNTMEREQPRGEGVIHIGLLERAPKGWVGHYAPVREEDFDLDKRFAEIFAVMVKDSLERTGHGLCDCGHPEDTGSRDHSPDCEYERAAEKAWGQAEQEELGHK